MAMSRRKQLHPKSLKDLDETVFQLPDELKCDEESHEIVARVEIEQGHRFGPFPAISLACQSTRLSSDSDSSNASNRMIVQIVDHATSTDHQRQSFQLLDTKYNWLARCSISTHLSVNLNVIVEDEQLFIIATDLIPIGTTLSTNTNIYPKISPMDDLTPKIVNPDHVKVKNEPVESESPPPSGPKKLHPLLFICDDCGIRFSNKSTLDAHRSHYCTKRETTKSQSTDLPMTIKIKSIKRKHIDINDSSSSPSKRLSLSSNENYCSECDILFSKSENFLQHKLYYCGRKSSLALCQSNEQNLSSSFRPTISFDRPIQIGQFIYVPVPIVSNERNLSPIANEPLDLSKPKKLNDKREKSISPLDLSIEKTTNLLPSTATKSQTLVLPQIFQCDYCSIRFSSVKTLLAHQENYCLEYRKQQKKNPSTNENNRCSSPSLVSKSICVSPNELSTLLPHRSSPFMCRLCKYRGNTLRGMRMHFKFHLSNNEPCSDEDIIVTSTLNPPAAAAVAVPSTNLVPSQILLKCTICSAMFDHEETLLNHLKCVHTKETLLECFECQSRFCSKWNLLRHMKLTHTNIKCDDEEEDEDEDQRNRKTNNQSPLNRLSPKMDEDRDLLPVKEKSSDPVNLTRPILIESMDLNSSKKLSNSSLILKKKFACPYCHIKFGSVDTLKQHMSNYCSSRPLTEDTLINHSKKKSFNLSSNETFCTSCQIPFRHQSSYEAHKMYYCRSSQKVHVKMQA